MRSSSAISGRAGTQITLYLRKANDDNAALTLSERIKALPEVAAVRYISPAQGMTEFKRFVGVQRCHGLPKR